jgi:two-component system, response regulator, stage 0 sporulation protein F
MAKLLIVDDEIDVREFAANFFRKRKLEVNTAANGYEAIEKVKQDKPDIVLLDIRMEGMSGIQTLEEIKKIDQAIQVFMVTGTNPKENEAYNKCLQLGAANYVHKPLKLEELEQVVMNSVNKITQP